MSLKIISSNIRFDNPKDAPHDWNGRRLVLSQNLTSYSPDVLGTQEGRKTQILDLHQLIPLSLVDQHRDWIEKRMYPSLFFNPQTIELQRSGDIWLSETPHVAGSSSFKSAFPRLCTWALFSWQGSEFYCFNLHLDHTTNEVRKQQIDVLIKHMKFAQNRPIILMGDFNESPKGEVRKSLKHLNDPWPSLNQKEEPSHHNQGEHQSFSSRIDWILTSNHFETQEIFLDKSHSEGVYPSDHYPLKASLKLN